MPFTRFYHHHTEARTTVHRAHIASCTSFYQIYRFMYRNTELVRWGVESLPGAPACGRLKQEALKFKAIGCTTQ